MALLKHNQTVFEDVVKAYKNNQSILLVHGTGLGKTFIFMELCKTIFKDKKILFVIPQKSIADGIKEYETYKESGFDITFKTYNYFSDTIKAKKLADKYDIIVYDEAHHLGSQRYGKNAREIFDYIKDKNKKILGMTATPLREDKINVSDYFEYTLLGETLFDAIREGVIPPFEYLICRDNGAEKTGYDRKERDFKKVIDYYESLPLLADTIDRNKRDRWLCFFNSIKELENYEQTIRELFTDEYTFLKITSKHDTSVTEITDYEKTVVLCVDKLLEGVHVPKTTGIILFRNVNSLPVFQQILGRVVHVGDEESPLILDCTKVAVKMLAKLLKEDRKGVSKITGTNNRKPILYCSINNVEHFNITKVLALSVDGGRWTEEEDRIVRENFLTSDAKAFKELLPYRTYRAISTRANSMGLLKSKITWTEEEDRIIKENPSMSIKELAKLCGKTEAAIVQRRQKLRINAVNKTRWTDEEIKLLKKYAPLYRDKELSEIIKTKSYHAIKGKKKELGLHYENNKLTNKDIDYIKDNSDKQSITEISETIQKSKKLISRKIKELNLTTVNRSKLFTSEMDNYIRENYNNKTDSEIALALGLCRKNVTSRRRILGLSKK